MALQTSTKLTYEDYLLLPDDGRRHEIIDGEHYVNPAPNTRHQLVSINLVTALHVFVRSQRLGRVLSAPYDVVFSNVDVVQPDIVFVGRSRMHLITHANLDGAPDLAIEILSESSRRYDEVIKRKRYETVGVIEYWIVDPELETVKIYRRHGELFASPEVVGTETGGTITTPLLPGFTLDIAEVFAE